MNKSRRLFYALWPTDELRREIHSLAWVDGGRAIAAPNLHITLVFLGSVAESRVADAVSCVSKTPVEPFELILGRVSWWQRQGLLCLEPTAGTEPLAKLVERLRCVLRESGFDVEQRAYRPHVSLAREVHQRPAIKPIRDLHWQVHQMELVESQTLPTGSVYTILPT